MGPRGNGATGRQVFVASLHAFVLLETGTVLGPGDTAPAGPKQPREIYSLVGRNT